MRHRYILTSKALLCFTDNNRRRRSFHISDEGANRTEVTD